MPILKPLSISLTSLPKPPHDPAQPPTTLDSTLPNPPSITKMSSNPPSQYSQPIANPIEYFKSIPWCNTLLSSPKVIRIQVPDRTPLKSTESAMVRETFNTPSTVKASITFLTYPRGRGLNGGEKVNTGEETGETKERPFVQVNAFLEVGSGINGYVNTAHGGFYGVVLDEVMGTAANLQAARGAYTSHLSIHYKRPLMTPSIVQVKGRVIKREGRKLWLRGSFEDKDGKVLAEAEGNWVMVDKDIGRSAGVLEDNKLVKAAKL